MKKIEAFVPQKAVENIKVKLSEAFEEAISKGERSEGCPGMSISEVEGKGAGHSNIHIWGRRKFEINIFPKAKIEIVVCDEDVEKVIDAIIKGVKEAKLETKHQGKIFVYNIEEAIRIRDSKRGEEVVK